MKYTKEQKMEMLQELYNEAIFKYCDEMAKKEYAEARKMLTMMEYASGLQKFIEE